MIKLNTYLAIITLVLFLHFSSNGQPFYPYTPINDVLGSPTNINDSDMQFLDWDNDGDVDVLVAYDNPTSVGLIRQTNAQKYEPYVSFAEFGNYEIITHVADIDSDNDYDFVVYVELLNQILIFTNDGDGFVSAPDTIHSSIFLRNFQIADIDNDGLTDLIFQYFNDSSEEVVGWMKNLNFGDFAQLNRLMFFDKNISGSTFEDIDEDGKLDFVYWSRTFFSSKLFSRNAFSIDSFVQENLIADLGYPISGLTLQDLNADGHLDILPRWTPRFQTETPSWLENKQNHVYSEKSLESSPTLTSHVDDNALRDLNKDGLIDIYYYAPCTEGVNEICLHWYENIGNDSFANRVIEPVSGLFYSIAQVTQRNNRDYFIGAYGSIGSISTDDPYELEHIIYEQKYPRVHNPELITLEDNASPSIVFLNQNFSGYIYQFKSNSGLFDQDAEQLIDTLCTSTYQLFDMDNDNDQDVVLSSVESDRLLLFKNNNNVFSFDAYLDEGYDRSNEYDLQVADLDGDGDTDIIEFTTDSMARVHIYENNGSGVFDLKNPQEHLFGSDNYHANFADLDLDSDLDLIYFHDEARAIYMFENDGQNNFSDTLIIALDLLQDVRDIQFEYLNGDSLLDMLVRVKTDINDYLYTIINVGGFTFETPLRISFEVNNSIDSDVKLGDLDGDQNIDIVISNNFGDLEYLINNGDGRFIGQQEFLAFNLEAEQIRLSDFDQDGDLDVFGGAAFDQEFVWVINEGGLQFSFGSVDHDRSRLKIIDLYDFEQDNDVDVLVAHDFSNSIGYLENRLKVVSTSEQEIVTNTNDLVLFPNPTQQSINVLINSFYQNATVEVFNILGESILKQQVKHKVIELETASWLDGIYFVNLRHDHSRNISTASFMVKH